MPLCARSIAKRTPRALTPHSQRVAVWSTRRPPAPFGLPPLRTPPHICGAGLRVRVLPSFLLSAPPPRGGGGGGGVGTKDRGSRRQCGARARAGARGGTTSPPRSVWGAVGRGNDPRRRHAGRGTRRRLFHMEQLFSRVVARCGSALLDRVSFFCKSA